MIRTLRFQQTVCRSMNGPAVNLLLMWIWSMYLFRRVSVVRYTEIEGATLERSTELISGML